MNENKILITKANDHHDCECCGLTTVESVMITYGEWSYGESPSAYCYNSRYTDEDEAFGALISHLGISQPSVVDEKDFASFNDYINHLKSLGFDVEVEFDYGDFDYEDDDDYDCRYESEYDECDNDNC